VKPTYQVRAWQEDNWWLARVMAASDGADTSPLNAITQARSVAKIESMSRDLIATILDVADDAFDVKFEYLLPGESGDLVCQARGARAWLDAAQDLWQERSATAARALAEEGFSLRETATLLGLSHQRVDQILGSHSERKQSNVLVLCEGPSDAAWLRQAMPSAERGDFAPVFVVVGGSLDSWVVAAGDREDEQARNHFWALLQKAASRASGDRNRTDPKVSSRASDWSPQDSRRSRQEAAVAARGKAWENYEEVAVYLLDQIASELGLERVEGKQDVYGSRTLTKWEIDGKGVRVGGEGFVIIECRRYTTSKQNQERVAGLAYRIVDTGASGGILVSPLGFQEGAKKVAAAEDIQEVLMDANSTRTDYVLTFLNHIFAGVSLRGEATITATATVTRADGTPETSSGG
jgi:hypothetical protein